MFDQVPNKTFRRGCCHTCHLEKKKKHYRENRESILASQKAYVAGRREETVAYQRWYRETHREELRLYNQQYLANHGPEQNAKRSAKYASDPEFRHRVIDRVIKWQRNNPDRVNRKKHRRRTRIQAAGGDYTTEQWEALKEKYGRICLRCGVHESIKRLTVDHVVPVSLGGSNSIDNLQPLCQSCNSTKHTEIVDYRQRFEETTNGESSQQPDATEKPSGDT